MRRDTNAWGRPGATLTIAGALGAIVLGAASDDPVPEGVDPVETGQASAAEASTVRPVAAALAVTAVGFGVLPAGRRCPRWGVGPVVRRGAP